MRKKALLLCVCFAFSALLLCGCQTQPEQSDETVVPEWKTAYLDFLESKKDYYLSYALVYIDDDDIPELYLSGNSEAIGDSVCTFKNGNVVEQPLNRIGGGRYIERSGDIINQNGNMGRIYTHVYKLTEAGFALTFRALSAEQTKHLGNDEYHYFYEYSIDDKPVSEGDYSAAVNAAFNFAQSVPLNENAVEYHAIRQQIMDYAAEKPRQTVA